jgi:hypothetical protein
MDLRTYRKRGLGTYADIAKRTGVSLASISFIASRKRKPSQRLAEAIERATGGHVKAAGLRRNTNLPAVPGSPHPPVPTGAVGEPTFERDRSEADQVDAVRSTSPAIADHAGNGRDQADRTASDQADRNQTNDAARLSVSAERQP